MKMTILQAKQKLHEKWMKLTKDGTDEEMMQALSIADTVLGNYDESLTSDIVDILEDIQKEIEMMSDTVVEHRSVTITSWTGMQKRIVDLVQSKIDKLKEEKE